MFRNSGSGWIAIGGAALLLAAIAYWLLWSPQVAPEGSPESQGFSSELIAEGLTDIRAAGIDIHSLTVVRSDVTIVDAGFYPYDGASLHDVASVTKSVLTTLVGIAADQGLLTLDDRVLSFFPDRIIANLDPAKEEITVRNLASMTSGLQCTAEDGERTLIEMRQSADWVQFVLDLPMISDPGSAFVYCSPGMHLLAAILQEATGTSVSAFAEANLFTPLGIDESIWPAGPGGVSHGWGDLRLRPLDMVKLGRLWLAGGVWEDRQIVPREWIEAAAASVTVIGEDDAYGLGFWIATDEPQSFSGSGRGGQQIVMIPGWDMVVVTTGGGFEFDQIIPFVLPSLVDPERPLAGDQADVDSLGAAIEAVALPPEPASEWLVPGTAEEISELRFSLEPNPFSLSVIELTFQTGSEASLSGQLDSGELFNWQIGLDGLYRFGDGDYGLPVGLRGAWLDETTFSFEYDLIANNGRVEFEIDFSGDSLVVTAQSSESPEPFRFEGVAVP